jgi:CDP-diacylglycerol---serine O-phosphatidyltransferase
VGSTVLPAHRAGLPFNSVRLVLMYAACIALRLARFNATLDDGNQPAYTREFFFGMPGPAAAGMAILPLVAKVQFGDGWWSSQWFFCPWPFSCSVLVVSRLPMRKISASVRPGPATLLAVSAIVAATAVLFPYIVIIVVNVAYLCHIPFSIRRHRWLAVHPEAWGEKPRQPRAARRAIRRAQPGRASTARLRLRRPDRTI